MYKIDLSPEARDDLKALRKHEEVAVVAATRAQLTHEPTAETRNRKRRRPNPLAEWELRAGDLRVLYNVDEEAGMVHVEAVGRKVGSVLVFPRRRSQQ
ncbi:MAG: addiction module toxin RelE [Planctomycetes bacterium]|nr:addiction module toxin RelE [Planctomycetota bacterium]